MVASTAPLAFLHYLDAVSTQSPSFLPYWADNFQINRAMLQSEGFDMAQIHASTPVLQDLANLMAKMRGRK